jgi:hypothetical protein
MPVAAPWKNENRGARAGQTASLPEFPEKPHEGIKANCQFALPFSPGAFMTRCDALKR